MARKIITQLVDDIDGSVLDAGEGESVQFSLDGTAYEIDLSAANASALREAFSTYVGAARRTSSSNATAPARQRRTSSTRSGETSAIREWATANGYSVSSRGRIPETVVAAYRAVN